MTKSAVTIGIAKATDAAEVMQFIREHWSVGHILGSSRELLDWQYATRDHYNIVIARIRDEGIVGLLGFIPLSRYDAKLTGSHDTVWLTIWKVRDKAWSGLGLRLLRHVQEMWPSGRIGTLGLNPATRGIYEALGYRTGALTRFALVRSGGPSRVLATIPDGWNPPRVVPGRTVFTEVADADFLERTAGSGVAASSLPPFKTCGYIRERYLQNPFYTYSAWLATEGPRQGVLITRLCTHAGASALRVVDFIGDPLVLAGAGTAFETLLQSSGAEYLDFFSEGISSELKTAGLFDAAQVPGLVLPGYFEPFDRGNVRLLYALRGPTSRAVLCKGDADQDRPNQLAANA